MRIYILYPPPQLLSEECSPVARRLGFNYLEGGQNKLDEGIEHQSADMVAFRAIASTCWDVYCSDSIFAYSLKSADRLWFGQLGEI